MRLPDRRPPGLRLAPISGTWWRIDHSHPDDWDWSPFPVPRYRFDSAAGIVRVRYAARTAVGAARERYRDTGSFIPADHRSHHLVRLTGRGRVLNLRSEKTLDALGLDDRISTGHEHEVWAAAQQLTDRVRAWWGERCDGIVYRSRTTPESSANLAFFAWAALEAEASPLAAAADLLDELVVGYGFTVDFRD